MKAYLIIPRVILAAALGWSALAASASAGTLFIGSDERSFDGVLPDQLGVAQITGANLVSQTNYATSFHINGLTDVSGQNYLYAGDPSGGEINKVSYTGQLLGTIAVPGIATACCNEDMIWTGTQLYHAQYGDGIQQIDINTGAVLSNQAQPDVVGMSYVGGQIWITHWGAHEVGIWDPTTNTFTAEFSTPSTAGGLAYDAADGIMWVGLGGGSVVPYTLGGVALNAGFKPFGDIGDTIDGLAFLGEATGGGVPEPSTWALMLLGFGSLGAALRNRRSVAAAA
ncbi:MAG TPA: PEPxxWA-CTERM sorting domain-containing protein [Phenylobacterium sp.]|jgi:hypothetical protein|nr:PEPxxWA-CTERM sorting domain-containing protein [Phenylobacterium sp.]